MEDVKKKVSKECSDKRTALRKLESLATERKMRCLNHLQ